MTKTAVPAFGAAQVAGQAVSGLVDLGKMPVIGYDRTITYDQGHKHVRHVVQRTSVQVAAWELALLAAGGAALLWATGEVEKNNGQGSAPLWPALGVFGAGLHALGLL